MILLGYSKQMCHNSPLLTSALELFWHGTVLFILLLGNIGLNDSLPVHRGCYSLLIKIPSGYQIRAGKVGCIKPPCSLEGDVAQNDGGDGFRQRQASQVKLCDIQTGTWMRLAAGLRLFSKCFCLCCSWTLRAKPEPRMPYKGSQWIFKINLFFSRFSEKQQTMLYVV